MPNETDLISKEEEKTTWRFYTTTQKSWEAMILSISSAKETIDFEQFNIAPDNIGRRFIQALIERAEDGVKVRVLVDALGSVGLGQSSHIEAMERAGINVKFFNWIFPFSKGNKSIWYFRDHRRSLLIDKQVLFTGGICIADQMKDWRETTAEMRGEVVEQAQGPFEKTWEKAHDRDIWTNFKTKINLAGFSFLTQSPLPRKRYIYYRLIEKIRAAQKYIYLTTPYFLPDNKLLRSLLSAKKRGVDVRILIPNTSDHPLVDRGSHTYFSKIISWGIKIYRYKGMIHAKTAVIDGDWAMVGTLNLDNVSLRYNFESAIIALNNQFASEITEHFQNDIQNADEVLLSEWEKRSYISQFLEILVWPIRKFL